jgi:DNA-binding transcriptional regulator YhcF (GntR family)|tara:strand:- start:20975 stop:22258 length:1284 start_codon:yes stop_codon:yes gene_type:complete
LIDKVVSLLRLKGEYLTPEIKFFIVALCHYSARKEKGVIVDTEKVLANDLGVSLSTMKQGIRYLEAQDFLLCDKTEAAVVKLEFTDAFFTYATKVSSNVEVENIVGQRIDNILSSEIFKSLSKRVAAKLFLLTLLAHSDEYGIVRNLSIKDLQELMGRFSKDRHRSQLELLKRAGYILGYSPGMSGGPILGKQKSEYLIKTTHKAMQSSSSTKTHSRLVIKNKSDSDFIAIRLSNLIDDIQKIDVHHEGTTKKINNLLQDLSLDGINEIEKVGNAFSGEVRGFQIQRFIFTLALYHLNKHDWQLPDVDQVRNSLDFEELFSEKFLRETLRVLIGDKEKISQKPLKEQVTHYEKLKQYMDQLMKNAPDTIATTNTNAQCITAINTLIAHCVVFTSKYIVKLLSEKVYLSNATGIAVFSYGEDIMLYFH